MASWVSYRTVPILAGVAALLLAAAPIHLTGMRVAPAQSSTDIYKSVYNGWKMWHVYCYRCHGVNAIASTVGPSLIEPEGQLPRAEFLKFVRNGYAEKGMPAWSKLLDDTQISDIQVYVKARTDKVLPPGRPDEVGPGGAQWAPPAGWRKPR